MPSIVLDVEEEIFVYCSCGKSLEASVRGMDVTVENCDRCMEKAIQEALDDYEPEVPEVEDRYNEGYDDGYAECFKEYQKLEV